MEAHGAAGVLRALDGAGGGAAAPRAPINVLFLTIDITIGGAERLVLDLVRHLDRRRFSPSVGWFSDEQPPREFEDLHVPLFPLRKRAGFDWGTMARLDAIVKEHRIDVINAHHFMSLVYACYAARVGGRTGLVYTEHSEADVVSASGAWRPIGAGLVRWCDAVVGVSEGVSKALASHFRAPGARLHTIVNGVDLDLFEAGRLDRAAARERIGLGPDDIVIGHVANFRRNKNHLFLLRAFHRAFAGRGDVKLVLVGQGFPGDAENSEPAIAAFVRENGLGDAVRLLGYRSDVHHLLRAMDVFCLVSYKEGLPLSVIEAMASGLPLVVTDIDGLRGLVAPGVNGMRVAPDDEPALAGLLERLASDPGLRRRLGQSSQRMARDKYSFARCLSETEQLLTSNASRRSVLRPLAG